MVCTFGGKGHPFPPISQGFPWRGACLGAPGHLASFQPGSLKMHLDFKRARSKGYISAAPQPNYPVSIYATPALSSSEGGSGLTAQLPWQAAHALRFPRRAASLTPCPSSQGKNHLPSFPNYPTSPKPSHHVAVSLSGPRGLCSSSQAARSRGQSTDHDPTARSLIPSGSLPG